MVSSLSIQLHGNISKEKKNGGATNSPMQCKVIKNPGIFSLWLRQSRALDFRI